jgi:hypothetical protein
VGACWLAGRRDEWWDQGFADAQHITGDLLVAQPDVIEAAVSEDDEFLILATDGLWCALKPTCFCHCPAKCPAVCPRAHCALRGPARMACQHAALPVSRRCMSMGHPSSSCEICKDWGQHAPNSAMRAAAMQVVTAVQTGGQEHKQRPVQRACAGTC